MALLLPCFDLAVPKLQREDQRGELICLFSEALLGLSGTAALGLHMLGSKCSAVWVFSSGTNYF